MLGIIAAGAGAGTKPEKAEEVPSPEPNVSDLVKLHAEAEGKMKSLIKVLKDKKGRITVMEGKSKVAPPAAP